MALLELLVALAIFATASLIAYRGLDSVASIKGALDQEIRFWRELGLVFERMEIDFAQILPHAFVSDEGAVHPPLRAGAVGETGFYMELSRFDAERPPARFFYRCDGGELKLALSPINGRSPLAAASAPQAPQLTLVHEVETCEVAFLSAQNVWLSAWPPEPSAIRPRGIRIRLTLAKRGQFERLYYLP